MASAPLFPMLFSVIPFNRVYIKQKVINKSQHNMTFMYNIRAIWYRMTSLMCCKHFHDRITSLRRKIWVHKTSLTPPLVIEVPVPRQECEWSCIFMLGGNRYFLFLRFFCWILEMFQQRGIYVFVFHSIYVSLHVKLTHCIS